MFEVGLLRLFHESSFSPFVWAVEGPSRALRLLRPWAKPQLAAKAAFLVVRCEGLDGPFACCDSAAYFGPDRPHPTKREAGAYMVAGKG